MSNGALLGSLLLNAARSDTATGDSPIGRSSRCSDRSNRFVLFIKKAFRGESSLLL